MIIPAINKLIVFAMGAEQLTDKLTTEMHAEAGHYDKRDFPDGESYLCIKSQVKQRHCLVVADLSRPNQKFLPLIFLVDTLKELGAVSVGVVAPYLSYMRQDQRFVEGEAITSRIFAQSLSHHIDYLVTVDPHLHRYKSLDEIYPIPNKVVQGAPALAEWLKVQAGLLLVGPDTESEQWVSQIAKLSGHPFIIGSKIRHGDRNVEITLPDLKPYDHLTAVIIDDVISSGQTILCCIAELKRHGIFKIKCAAVHGIFAEGVDKVLLAAGLTELLTSNTIAHTSNVVDISSLLIKPITECLADFMEKNVIN